MSFRVSATGALLLGSTEEFPGAEVAVSVMLPIPTEWWLRPVSMACRVGAHSAVVWNRLNFRPPAASRSAVGVAHGPPNALEAPNPTSSSRMTRTFGAPFGGVNGTIGGYDVSGSFASYVVRPGATRWGIGRIARELGSSPMGQVLRKSSTAAGSSRLPCTMCLVRAVVFPRAG